jgi:hypothetical protein
MTKGQGAWGPVGADRVESNHHLAAAPRPTATLGRVTFADKNGGKQCRAVRPQVEGEDAFRRIRRRRMALVYTGQIDLSLAG